MSDGVFRFFNPAAPREDPKEKRRRQLRQAQRTFRGRKELYARTLEKELDRARASEAQLMKQCARLQGEVDSLAGCLARHGIARPAEPDPAAPSDRPRTGSPPSASFVASAAATGAPPSRGRSATHAGHGAAAGGSLDAWVGKTSPYRLFPGADPGQHHQPYHRPSEAHSPPLYVSASPESQGNSPAHSAPQRGAPRVADLDPCVVGMEFVLILEDPCRGHLHGDPNKPCEATGHALTASGRLLSVSALPAAELPAGGAAAAAHAARFAPPGLLDRLLRLSSDLAAENEVTPTQAWQYLRAQPRFADLELARVYAFARQLRDIIKCRGFGGVLDIGIFRRAVLEFIGLGPLINAHA